MIDLTNPSLHPITLLKFVTQRYGLECYDWQFAVMARTLATLTSGKTIPEINIHKTLAAITVASQDGFWRDWRTFHFVSQALNNNTPSATALQEQTTAQMAFAVEVAQQVRKDLGPLASTPNFSSDVESYIAAVAKNEGIWFLPPPLDFASDRTSGLSVRCNDCGDVSDLESTETPVCPVCTQKWDTTSLRSWSPNPLRVKLGIGLNVAVFEKNPTEGVKTRLAEKLQKPETLLTETREDVCVAKLLVVFSYLAQRRKELEQQLKLMET